jgi:HK97 family phage prohead protease
MSAIDTRFEVREVGNGRAEVVVLASHTWREERDWYEIGGGKLERIMPGAFQRSLASNPDISLLIGHSGLPLARSRPLERPTLQARETYRGLEATADLDLSDPDVQSVIPKIRAGACEASFSFRVMRGGDQWNDDFSRRTLTAVNLERGDCSIVAQGANPHTGVTMRAGETLEQRRRMAERIGDRVLGPLFTGFDACVRCGGGDPLCPSCGSGSVRLRPPLVADRRAEQRLDLMRVDLGQALPARPATRRARKALIDARALSKRRAEELELLRAMKRR